MKYLKSILILFLFTSSISAQNDVNYKFTLDETDSSKYFSLDLPQNWQITTETTGTPYAVIGFEGSSEGTFLFNKCAPEMRMGIKILNLDLEKAIESIGLYNPSNNYFYMFQDTDGYINIIVTTKTSIENIVCMDFSIDKLSDCVPIETKKVKKKNRVTTPKSYSLFSYNNTTICIESFNMEFDEKFLNLLKSSFKINN